MKRKSSSIKPNPVSNFFLYPEKDFCKRGWLRKQGGTFKTTKRRYFVLTGDYLYYFTNQTLNCPKGQICIRNLELSGLEEDKSSGEYSFSILPEVGQTCVHKNHILYQLYCDDKNEAEQWIQQLKQSIYLRRGGGLFGTPLGTVAHYLKNEHCYVPRIVFECCQRIREVGMNEEGIFRKNGQQSLVYQMKTNVDRGKFDWEDVDVYTICSLLKLYLRELPEPVIPFSHYDSLKAIGYRIEAKEDLSFVREKLSLLPPENLQLLKFLCEFLLEVSTHPENRMEILSLASVFSPNILRDEDTDPYIEETTSSIITNTVAAIIRSQEDLLQFEYKPMVQSDTISNNVEEEDSFSIASAVSNMNISAITVPIDSNIDRKKERAHSITFPNYRSGGSCSNLSDRSRHDSVDVIAPRRKVQDINKSSLVEANTAPLPNGTCESDSEIRKSRVACDRCNVLEDMLVSASKDREIYLQMYMLAKEECKQLREEVERLHNLSSIGRDVNGVSSND